MKKKFLLFMGGVMCFVALFANLKINSGNRAINLSMEEVEGFSACENVPGANNGHCVADSYGHTFCAKPESGQQIDCVQQK